MSTAPLLYIFSEDTGSRESCSIFYARYLIVEPPAGGEAEVEKALDSILKRKRSQPDWKDEDVWRMVGHHDIDGIDLLVGRLADYGIKAWNPETHEMIADESVYY